MWPTSPAAGSNSWNARVRCVRAAGLRRGQGCPRRRGVVRRDAVHGRADQRGSGAGKHGERNPVVADRDARPPGDVADGDVEGQGRRGRVVDEGDRKRDVATRNGAVGAAVDQLGEVGVELGPEGVADERAASAPGRQRDAAGKGKLSSMRCAAGSSARSLKWP